MSITEPPYLASHPVPFEEILAFVAEAEDLCESENRSQLWR